MRKTTIDDSKFGKFYSGVLKSLPLIAVIFAATNSVLLGVYYFGSSQSAQAAEVQKQGEKITSIETTIKTKSDVRDKQLEKIEQRMANKDDINNVEKQLQLMRQERAEDRALMFKILESR